MGQKTYPQNFKNPRDYFFNRGPVRSISRDVHVKNQGKMKAFY